jgi:hypothetical protein
VIQYNTATTRCDKTFACYACTNQPCLMRSPLKFNSDRRPPINCTQIGTTKLPFDAAATTGIPQPLLKVATQHHANAAQRLLRRQPTQDCSHAAHTVASRVKWLHQRAAAACVCQPTFSAGQLVMMVEQSTLIRYGNLQLHIAADAYTDCTQAPLKGFHALSCSVSHKT